MKFHLVSTGLFLFRIYIKDCNNRKPASTLKKQSDSVEGKPEIKESLRSGNRVST